MDSQEKILLRNLYKIADYHGNRAKQRMNRIDRSLPHRMHDEGLAEAYEWIRFMLQRPEILELTDYDKVHNTHTELPSWLNE